MSVMRASHILLIDDDPLLLRALKLELKSEPYTLHLVQSASEAMQALFDLPIDVVLTDHHMPDRTGLEFLCDIKNQYPNIIRGMITGQPDVSIYTQAVNQGQVHFLLTKPWQTEDLRTTIRSAVARKRAQESLSRSNRGAEALIELTLAHPGITSVKRTETGAIHLEEDELR